MQRCCALQRIGCKQHCPRWKRQPVPGSFNYGFIHENDGLTTTNGWLTHLKRALVSEKGEKMTQISQSLLDSSWFYVGCSPAPNKRPATPWPGETAVKQKLQLFWLQKMPVSLKKSSLDDQNIQMLVNASDGSAFTAESLALHAESRGKRLRKQRDDAIAISLCQLCCRSATSCHAFWSMAISGT